LDIFINRAIEANREIYNLINNGLENFHYIYHNIGFGGDRSSKIDLVAEEIFVKYLSEFGKIFSEESGIIGDGEATIILDPIDGSDNILSNVPYYGSSIALEINQKIVVGIICNFATGEIFIKDSNSFRYANLNSLNFQIVLPNNYSRVGIFERAYKAPNAVKALYDGGIKYRSLGALALSLANSFSVEFVLFVGEIRSFDVEAGLFMCEELNVLKDEKFILISKSQDSFNKVYQLIKGKI